MENHNLNYEEKLIDYLINKNLLVRQEIKTAKKIINAFQKQKSLSCGLDYDKVFVDGGKQDPNWELIIQANRNWTKYQAIFGAYVIDLMEKYLCTERTTKDIKKELGKNFFPIVNEIVMAIEKLTRKKSNDWELMLLEINKSVRKYGFRKTAKKLNINFRTLKNIIDGKKTISVESYEKIMKKILSFFRIDTIQR